MHDVSEKPFESNVFEQKNNYQKIGRIKIVFPRINRARVDKKKKYKIVVAG